MPTRRTSASPAFLASTASVPENIAVTTAPATNQPAVAAYESRSIDRSLVPWHRAREGNESHHGVDVAAIRQAAGKASLRTNCSGGAALLVRGYQRRLHPPRGGWSDRYPLARGP